MFGLLCGRVWTSLVAAGQSLGIHDFRVLKQVIGMFQDPDAML